MSASERQIPAPVDLRSFLDRIPTMAWSALSEGSLDFFNQPFRDYVGLSLDQLYGLGWKSAVHGSDIQQFENWWRNLKQSQEAGTTEVRLRRFDGSPRWFLIFANPVRDESGNLVRWYGTNLDIEDRKRAEEILQARELSWRQIVDNVPGLVATMGAKGEVEFLNRQTLQYFGKTTEDLKNWALTDVIHPDDLPRIIEARIRAIEEGGIYEVEHRCRRADGVYRWFQVRGLPVRDTENKISAWYLLLTDIDDLKRAEQALQRAQLYLTEGQRLAHTGSWVFSATGFDYWSPELFRIHGLDPSREPPTVEEYLDLVHPEDREFMQQGIQKMLTDHLGFDFTKRIVRPGGKIRHVRCVGAPAGDESTFQGFIGTAIDITEQEQLTQKLRQSEADFRTITNNIPGFVHTMDPTGEVAFLNNQILEYFGKAGEELKDWSKAGVVHPEDLPRVVETFKRSIETGQICEIELRCLRADGVYRWFQSRGRPVRDTDGKITAWYFLLTDIDDRKRAEQKLQQSERDLRTITDSIPQPIVVLSPDGKTLYVNQVALDLTGLTMDQLDEKGFWARIVHSDDLERLRTQRQERLLRGDPFELEFRALFKNGQYRWQLMQYTPLKDESGQIIRWYSTATDIDDRKRAEEKLRQSEENLRTITDTIRQPIWVLAPDGTILYANRVVRELTGLTTSDVNDQPFTTRVFDPDDRERVRAERHEGLLRGAPFEMEGRILLKSGQYRWHLVQYNPLKDESGQIIRWYATATDIDDRKKTEERLHNENLELREEIDRSSMFEEIVGSSKPMSQLLKKVEKVAPSDSTVLILGETGTGKELIARALHRRSKRASRAFVKVNCAAIPQSLIASELFGHEKGAFTGALQRRLGRFEAANGGTLFLDEIGELPMETQIAFLRVLQEREFERVGSNHPISVDVRLIAATNRDLPNAVAAGTFRQDLFYRLDVFPIAVPPLRERAEDIPLLVEYFVGRFAKDAGKNIRHIGKQTLEQLQSYRWPGNIRELQNVVERAVILCETDTFVVDESWLESESEESSQREGLSALGEREVEMIEAALAETHGRISGPAGAAAKLGIPRQTLESKIRRLGIDKYGQKRPTT